MIDNRIRHIYFVIRPGEIISNFTLNIVGQHIVSRYIYIYIPVISKYYEV